MEQYYMPKQLDFENLRLCLDQYTPNSLYIASISETRRQVQVNKNLEGKKLDFKKDSSGLHLIIDSDEVFHFPLRRYPKGFSVAYERLDPSQDGLKMNLRSVDNPYDSSLPEPISSKLRTVLDEKLMEIGFDGRIHLKFHSWLLKPGFKYWMVDRIN